MKYGLFSVGLMAALLAAGGASAEIVGSSDNSYPTVDEAIRNAPPVPADCLDASEANICKAIFLAEDGGEDDEEGVYWRFLWATADTPVICVDRATADFRVDCDAPDAVQHLEIRMRSCAGDGTDCHTVPWGTPRPYRPTPARSGPVSRDERLDAGVMVSLVGAKTPPASSRPEPAFFRTPEEALANMPEPDSDCFDDAGANVCTALPLLMGDPEAQLWSPLWATPDRPLECIDRATGDVLDCEAPGALRTLAHIPLLLRVIGPDGKPGPATPSPARGQWVIISNGDDDSSED